jgi:hypothetical protein
VNARGLAVPGGHVRNGDLWDVAATHPDGSLTVTPAGRYRRRHPDTPTPQVRLPAGYVRDNVELGYATTTHRAQGVTVDRAHVLAAPGMTREAFYVAMTRGRVSNHAYVSTDAVDPACDELPDRPQRPAPGRSSTGSSPPPGPNGPRCRPSPTARTPRRPSPPSSRSAKP